MTPTEKAVEVMAALIDPPVFDGRGPVPTRDDTINWHERRKAAYETAGRIISLHPGIASLIEGTGAIPPGNIAANGALYCFGGEYLDWSPNSDTACLDGHFTAKDLRAIADHMDRAMLAAAEGRE